MIRALWQLRIVYYHCGLVMTWQGFPARYECAKPGCNYSI